jgi:hypothetical protein
VKDFTGLGLTFSDACSCFNPHGCRIYLYFYTKKGRFINKKAKNHLNFPTPSYSVLCFQLFLFSTSAGHTPAVSGHRRSGPLFSGSGKASS